jgi:hypothetical protein
MTTEKKPEVFAVVWVDNWFGPLHLPKPDAASAIEAAAAMREKGDGKITGCRAVHLQAGADKILYLD